MGRIILTASGACGRDAILDRLVQQTPSYSEAQVNHALPQVKFFMKGMGTGVAFTGLDFGCRLYINFAPTVRFLFLGGRHNTQMPTGTRVPRAMLVRPSLLHPVYMVDTFHYADN